MDNDINIKRHPRWRHRRPYEVIEKELRPREVPKKYRTTSIPESWFSSAYRKDLDTSISTVDVCPHCLKPIPSSNR